MKAVTLTLAATTVASASVPRALLNLRNHSLLNTSKDVSPLETIAHLATFEDVPVFGGFELREEMLKSIAEAKPSHFDQLTDSFFGAVTKATRVVGCQAQMFANTTLNLVLKKEGRLGYGSYCEELPTTRSLRADSLTTE